MYHACSNSPRRVLVANRDDARALLDSGADLVFGHGTHTIQGVEIYNGKPILYDTGDFVDDYAVDPELRNDLSGLFLLRARSGKAAIESVEELRPVRGEEQARGQPGRHQPEGEHHHPDQRRDGGSPGASQPGARQAG
jgi:poly-gamma-glutamate synthesis protein (capsule biosynthesis protein)